MKRLNTEQTEAMHEAVIECALAKGYLHDGVQCMYFHPHTEDPFLKIVYDDNSEFAAHVVLWSEAREYIREEYYVN